MKKYSFKIHGNKYDVDIKDVDGNKAEVCVNGTSYSVDIDKSIMPEKTPRLVRKPVKNKPEDASIPKAGGTGGKLIKAPLPGSIFKMLVAVGDTIKPGDTVLILEAMKMENNVVTDLEGTITSIEVKEGQAVLEGDTLISVS